MNQKRFERLSYNVSMMMLAAITAHRSTCSRRAVGCVLLKNGKVVGTGYNGAPHGMDHCIENGCITHEGHCIQCIHAELNAALQCRELPDEAFCTDTPCLTCLRALLQLGVERIIFWRTYEDPSRDAFISQNHIGAQLIRVNEDQSAALQEMWEDIERLYRPDLPTIQQMTKGKL